MLSIPQKQTIISLLAAIDDDDEEGFNALFEHIHALENAAYLRGYDEGREYGYDDGYESGRDYGYDSGYDAGYDTGYENAVDASR